MVQNPVQLVKKGIITRASVEGSVTQTVASEKVRPVPVVLYLMEAYFLRVRELG